MKNILAKCGVVLAVVIVIGFAGLYIAQRSSNYREAEDKANTEVPSYVVKDGEVVESSVPEELLEDDSTVENGEQEPEDVEDADSEGDEDQEDTLVELNADDYAKLVIATTNVKLSSLKDFKDFTTKYSPMLTTVCYESVKSRYTELTAAVEDPTEGYTEDGGTDSKEYPIYDENLYIIEYGTKEESDMSYKKYKSARSSVKVIDSVIDGMEITYTVLVGGKDEMSILVEVEAETGLVSKIVER